MTMFWKAAGLAVVLLILWLAWRRGGSAQPREPEPPRGQATPADVERLVQAGQLIGAIRCYRELHRCSLVEAKEAVEAMRRPG